MVYEMCRKFADEELAPNAGEWDQKHLFPTEAVDKLVRNLCVLCVFVLLYYILGLEHVMCCVVVEEYCIPMSKVWC